MYYYFRNEGKAVIKVAEIKPDGRIWARLEDGAMHSLRDADNDSDGHNDLDNNVASAGSRLTLTSSKNILLLGSNTCSINDKVTATLDASYYFPSSYNKKLFNKEFSKSAAGHQLIMSAGASDNWDEVEFYVINSPNTKATADKFFKTRPPAHVVTRCGVEFRGS